MIDIYCKYDYCPICDSHLIENNSRFSKECINNCYCIYCISSNNKINLISVYIFDTRYIASDDVEIRISEEIKYWKENDRYLMKILEGR